MKFKLSAFLIALLLLTACSVKESLQERFKTDIDSFTGAYNNADWEKVTSMMYPKLFTVTSKEELINTLKSLDSSGMKTQIKVNSIDSVSPEEISGEEKFVLINYSTSLQIELMGGLLDKKELLKAGFESQFGAGKVKFDEAKNIFTIAAKQKMIAVTPKDKNDWKYIEHDTTQGDYITRMILPEEIIKKFEGK